MGNPTGKGGFKKGKSGNPGGKPKVVGHIRELARDQSDTAITTLAEICGDTSAPQAARVAAAQALLDRGWGKPTQHIEADVNFLDKLDLDEQRSLLSALAALSGDETAATEGTDEAYH